LPYWLLRLIFNLWLYVKIYKIVLIWCKKLINGAFKWRPDCKYILIIKEIIIKKEIEIN
jgi:hypothetical protein